MRWADVVQEEPVDPVPPMPKLHRFGQWVVAIYFVYPAATGLLFSLLVQSGMLAMPPEVMETLREQKAWEYLASDSIFVLNLIGGILVLLRRRAALPILLASTGIVILILSYYIVEGRLQTPPGIPKFAPFLPYIILALALGYVYLLRRRGVLYR
jgi:hypothetical protein